VDDLSVKYWLTWVYGIICTALTTAFGCFVKKYRTMMKRQHAIELGTQALLRAQIIHIYNKYMEKEYLPIYERENVEELYIQYKNLGGNGTIKKLYEMLCDLPTEIKSNR
jgi:hypothetical protein